MIFDELPLKKYITETVNLGDGETMAEIVYDNAKAFVLELEVIGYRAEKRFDMGSTEGVFYAHPDGDNVYFYKNAGVPFARAVIGAKLPQDDTNVGDPIYRDTVFYQAKNSPNPLGGGMTYLVRLRDGRFIVVDGGGEISPECFFSAMKELHPNIGEGGPFIVAAWFITHPHDDHIELLKRLMSDEILLSRLKIERFYANLPDESVLVGVDDQVIPDNNFVRAVVFEYVKAHGGKVSKPYAGMSFNVGELRFEVMYTAADWFSTQRKTINDASMIFAVSREGGKKVLFLGDIMNRVTVPLKKMYAAGELHADAVQVAHHAHVGPDTSFYEYISPKMLFWPISNDCYFLPDDDQITVRNRQLRQLDVFHCIAYLGAAQIVI